MESPKDRLPRVLASTPTQSNGVRPRVRYAALLVAGVLSGVVIGVVVGGRSSTTSPAPGNPNLAGIEEGTRHTFAHSREGAVAAAAAYPGAFGASEIVDQTRLGDLIDAIAIPRLAARLRTQAGAMQRSPGIRRLQSAAGRGGVFAQETPLAYRVVSYAPQRATVELWVVSVLAGGRVQPQARFARSREILTWSGNDWKLAALPRPVSGPTPGIERGSATNSSRAFVHALRPYAELRSGP